MKIKLHPAQICLSGNQTLEIEEPGGCRLVCRSGSVWITQDGDYRDIILDEGDTLAFDQPGTVLVNAFRAAMISVEASHEDGDAPSSAAGIGGRLWHSVGQLFSRPRLA